MKANKTGFSFRGSRATLRSASPAMGKCRSAASSAFEPRRRCHRKQTLCDRWLGIQRQHKERSLAWQPPLSWTSRIPMRVGTVSTAVSASRSPLLAHASIASADWIAITTLSVDVYDTASGQWTKGPDLPNGKSKGFGCSAVAQNGRLYANAFKGDLLPCSGRVFRIGSSRKAHTQINALGGEDGENKRPKSPKRKRLKAPSSLGSQLRSTDDGLAGLWFSVFKPIRFREIPNFLPLTCLSL
jgi:hypothetical protein